MNTSVIGIKDFRQNITKLSKKAQAENTTYVVTVRNKPVFEVKPCFNAQVELDDTQIEYYKALEQSLDFWKGTQDDDIFVMPSS